MNIYVGGLSAEITKEDLLGILKDLGQILSVIIMDDERTHEPRGFGFVEVTGEEQAQEAINLLNSRELKGQRLVALPYPSCVVRRSAS